MATHVGHSAGLPAPASWCRSACSSGRRRSAKRAFLVFSLLALSAVLTPILFPTIAHSRPSFVNADPGAGSVDPGQESESSASEDASKLTSAGAAHIPGAKAGENAAGALSTARGEGVKDREGLLLWNGEQAAPAEIKSRLLSMRNHAGSLTDKFMEKIAQLTAQIDLLRMEVNKAKGEIQHLNESFDGKTEETLRMIDSRSADFIRGLSRVEEQLDAQLRPPNGAVYKHLQELRDQLTQIRAQAESSFNTEASSVMRQIDTCSAKVDELTRVYFDMRHRMDVEVNDIDARMIAARRELDDLVHERLTALGEAEQRITADAITRLRDFLQNLHLEENMLQDMVQSIQRDFLEPSSFTGSRTHREKGATYIDLSSSFASSKIEKVCGVMTHLVKQLLPGKTVIPIFIHTVPQVSTTNLPNREKGVKLFGGLGGARALFNSLNLGPSGWGGGEEEKKEEKAHSEAPIIEMVLPDEHMIAAVAVGWLRERQRTGPLFDHYAVVRVDGLLAESYTVPFLQYLQFDYTQENRFALARTDQFAEKLETTIHEKLSLLAEALEKNTYLLIAYLGEATGDVKPQPSLVQTKNRISTARRLLKNLKAPSLGAYFWFEQFKHQLQFIDEVTKAFARNQKKRLANKVVLQGDDFEIVVVVGRKGTGGEMLKISMPPCRQGDPFFLPAFTILSMNLTALTPELVAFPSDGLLARTLQVLLSDVRGGAANDEESAEKSQQRAPTCGATISTNGVTKRMWRPQVLKVSLSYMEKIAESPRGGAAKNNRSPALKHVPVVQDSTQDAIGANLPKGYEDLAQYIIAAISRVLRDRLEVLPRGFTLYVVANVKE